MRLTRFTDISLRALMYLGAHGERPVSTAEMSARLRVSKDHLMKSLQSLAGLGLVAGARGRGGGFRLARAGASIRLGGLALVMAAIALGVGSCVAGLIPAARAASISPVIALRAE